MNRRELVKALAEYTGQEVKSVEATVRGFEDVVLASIGKGEPVVLSGFAKFARVDRKARMGRNPATGEPVKIKATRKARITPLKTTKDVVSGAAPAPKITAAKPAAAASTAKKATTTRATTTRATTAKKTTARKTTAKKAAPAKRAPAAKKTTARKTTAKKAAPAKRAPAAKKTTARKTTAKKAAPAKRAAKKR